MSEPTKSTAHRPATPTESTIAERLNRLEVWSLGPWVLAIIGIGFLFIYYDILDINVSFIQTCVQLKPGCTPETALSAIALPILLNLIGYALGALVLCPICDTVGRRHMLMITMLIAGIGSLYSALAPDYANFVGSRALTGIGVGADLAVVNTYLNEVAPRRTRGRFHSSIFTMSAVGSFLGVWVALILTTGTEPWPAGLPGALAGPAFTAGWRWTYGIGALLALVGLLLRFRLPESPRWLAWKGRVAESDEVVKAMEDRAARRGPLAPVGDAPEKLIAPLSGGAAYRAIFSSRRYTARALIVFLTWGLLYTCIYSFVGGYTSILIVGGYAPPEAGIITAVGVTGLVACSIVATLFADRLDRRLWLLIGAVITALGGILVATGGGFLAAFSGSAIVFFGFNLWSPIGYAWTAENFPTRSRSSGFALVDGIGHAGGGVGVLLIVPLIPKLGPLYSFLVITAFMFAAAAVAHLGPQTQNRNLEEVAP